MADAALRFNAGKPDLSFLLGFSHANEALARVFEQGAIKYERDNWKKGGKPDAEYLGSALRHIQKHADGQLWDADTGCLHLAHAVWNLNALIELNVTSDVPAVDPEFDQAAFAERYAPVQARP